MLILISIRQNSMAKLTWLEKYRAGNQLHASSPRITKLLKEIGSKI